MKHFVKLIALVLTLSLCLCFAACGKEEGRSLDDVKKAGKLVIATSPDFPPFETIEGGKVTGIEIEIMETIAKNLGVELVIEQVNFDSVLPGIQSGKYDVGVSGITVTDERKNNVDFTKSYFEAAQVIVVKADSPIKSKADLAGKKISAQTGTTAEEYCLGEKYSVSAFESNNDAYQAMVDGKVDAWVVDNEVAVNMIKGKNDVKKLDENMTTEPYAFACPKGSTTLVEALNAELDTMLKDGTIEKLFEKYGAVYNAPKN